MFTLAGSGFKRDYRSRCNPPLTHSTQGECGRTGALVSLSGEEVHPNRGFFHSSHVVRLTWARGCIKLLRVCLRI